MKRRLTIALLLIGGLLATTLTGGYLLLATPGGSQWLIERVVARTEAEIRWQRMTGTLLNGLDIRALTIKQPALTISVGNLSGRWQLLQLLSGSIDIGQLQLEQLFIEQTPTSEESASPPWPSLSSTLPIHLGELAIHQLRYQDAEQQITLDRLTASGTISLLGIQLQQLTMAQPGRQLNIKGKLGGQPPYRLNLTAEWQMTLPDQPTYTGNLAIGGNLASINLQHQLLTPYVFNSEGTLETGFDRQHAGLDPALFNASLDHHWRLENTLLPGWDQAVSSEGNLTSSGSLADYQLLGQFQLSLPTQPVVPALQLSLSGHGNPDNLSIEQLTLASEAGTVHIAGDVQWREAPSGSLQIDMEQIAPGHFTDKFNGELSGRLHLDGHYAGQQLTLHTTIEQVSGNLNGYPLSLKGQLGYQNGALSSEGLNLRVGENHLMLKGTAAEQIQLHWQLDAPNLAALYPPLTGQLQSDGQLTGSRDNPLLQGKLNGHQLAIADQHVERLEASFLRQQNGQQQLQLSAQDLELTGAHLDKLNLKATGQLDVHRYQLTLNHPEGTLQLKGAGHYREDHWQTQLLSGDIQSSSFGAWQLAAPFESELSLAGSSLERHCWQQQSGQICAALKWAKQPGIALNVEIQQLPASLLQTWLPQHSTLSGTADGELEVSGQPDDLRGQWSLRAPLLLVRLEEQPPRELELRESEIHGSLQQQVMRLSAQSRLLGSGQIDGSLQWPLQPGPVSGKVNLHFSTLDWLDPFVLYLDDLNGQADGTVDLSGTKDDPKFSGGIRLSSLSAYVPELGITLHNGALNLTHQQQREWQISGKLDSGEGALAVAGSLAFNQADNWHSQLDITGHDVEVLDLETINASLSPTLKLAATPGRLDVTGDVVVPSAEIRLKELPESAITVSEDQIIIDGPVATESKPSRQAVHTNINLILGEQVQFSGFGIKGRLSGKLNIEEQPGRPNSAKGILVIHDGSYRTYGQRLRIDSGSLIFQGDPDHPLIHMSASRTVGNTLVGIRIDGMPESLSSDVFSTPSLPQTEAMALLMTGKSLASASQKDAATLTSAATALGFSQSEGLTQQLQNYLGLDTLSVSSESGIKESALTVGKYLTPRLYVGYIQDIMSPNAGIELEYSITERLKIKAESGETQSMDVLLRLDQQ
ncbi:translocation/assembly module TamB domain-containing protein [Porticoccus sp.]